MQRRTPPVRKYPVAFGSAAVAVSATPDGTVRWFISTTGLMPTHGIVLRLDPWDIVALGKRSVAALKAANRDGTIREA